MRINVLHANQHKMEPGLARVAPQLVRVALSGYCGPPLRPLVWSSFQTLDHLMIHCGTEVLHNLRQPVRTLDAVCGSFTALLDALREGLVYIGTAHSFHPRPVRGTEIGGASYPDQALPRSRSRGVVWRQRVRRSHVQVSLTGLNSQAVDGYLYSWGPSRLVDFDPFRSQDELGEGSVRLAWRLESSRAVILRVIYLCTPSALPPSSNPHSSSPAPFFSASPFSATFPRPAAREQPSSWRLDTPSTCDRASNRRTGA